MRTKAEVRRFLDSLVGRTCVDKSDARLNGQCVCLIKNLMEFLGVANPYAARGNAKDVGDTYIRNGIGTNGRGWLTVVVNRDMGVIGGIRYGHVWIDLQNEANYESNGARALITTKNTRPISQGQQFINFDKWIKEDDVLDQHGVNVLYRFLLGRSPDAGANRSLVGKVSFNKAYNDILKSAEYRARTADSRAGKLKPQNHLPSALRNVYKPPVAKQDEFEVVTEQLWRKK